jgi:hypothetical protein
VAQQGKTRFQTLPGASLLEMLGHAFQQLLLFLLQSGCRELRLTGEKSAFELRPKSAVIGRIPSRQYPFRVLCSAHLVDDLCYIYRKSQAIFRRKWKTGIGKSPQPR